VSGRGGSDTDGASSRRRGPSSRDIAREAGVSQSTVSRVMNNSPMIGEAARRRVEAAMVKLGYTRNGAARTLITGRSHLLGLVVSNITNPFYPEVIEAVIATAAEHRYNVLLCNTQENPELQLAYLSLLLEHRVDGAILTSALLDSADLVARMKDEGTPLVMVNRVADGQWADSVRLDDELAGYLAASHFISLGHTAIAFVGGHPRASTNAHRLRGYRRALKEHGIARRPELISSGQFTRECGNDAATRLMALPARPTALVCADDVIALGALDAIFDAGLSVPDDVAVLGVDDVPAASLRQVALSSIRQSATEMGQRATSLLIARIEGETIGDPIDIVLAPQLVIRRTCGAAR
jgi:LacI family transcriptional regulator